VTRCFPWGINWYFEYYLGEIQTLIAGLLPQRPGFDHRSVGQVFLRVLRFSPVTVCPPLLCPHIHLHTTRMRRTSGRNLGYFKENNVLSDIRTDGIACLQYSKCQGLRKEANAVVDSNTTGGYDVETSREPLSKCGVCTFSRGSLAFNWRRGEKLRKGWRRVGGIWRHWSSASGRTIRFTQRTERGKMKCPRLN